MKIANIYKSLKYTLLSFALMIPLFVNGQSVGNPPTNRRGNPGEATSFQNPLKFDTLSDFLEAFLKLIIKVGFPFIVLAVIYTGFLFVKAQGNQEELQTAKRAFMWTVVGALILLGATAISALIKGTVGEITK